MKFEYDEEDAREDCVAYIDVDGELVIKGTGTSAVWFDKFGRVHKDFTWDESNSIHRFYPGDKITITF